MNKLQVIKDKVVQKRGFASFDNFDDRNSYSYYDSTPDVIDEIARKYAKQVAEDALKRAAEGALLITTDVDGNEYRNKTERLAFAGDESPAKVSVDKQSILSTPINLEL